MAGAMSGAMIFENPAGSPRFRSVMWVEPSGVDDQVYVVSIGNGPCCVRMTMRVSGSTSTMSYVYSSRRPRNRATNATAEPIRNGGTVFHSTDSMLAYHSGAFDGSAAYAATSATGR